MHFAKFPMLIFSKVYVFHSFHPISTQVHMGLKISKHYCSCSFIWSQPNFMINKAVIREYKAINVLVICQKLKFVAVWNFNMGVTGKILKCAISWKRWNLDFENSWIENSRIWKLVILVGAYVMYFLCLILWFQFGVIRCTLQNSWC